LTIVGVILTIENSYRALNRLIIYRRWRMPQTQILVALCGCQFTGKTTIGDRLREILGIPFVAVDRLRPLLFGPSRMYVGNRELDDFQLSRAYPAMAGVVERLLTLGESLIVEGTFSRQDYQQEVLVDLPGRYGIKTRTILLEIPDEKTLSVVRERAESRRNGNDPSAATTIDDYLRVKERFEPLVVPHLRVDTTEPLETCLSRILDYLKQA